MPSRAEEKTNMNNHPKVLFFIMLRNFLSGQRHVGGLSSDLRAAEVPFDLQI
jgi:hypothetical protein